MTNLGANIDTKLTKQKNKIKELNEAGAIGEDAEGDDSNEHSVLSNDDDNDDEISDDDEAVGFSDADNDEEFGIDADMEDLGQ